MGRRANLAHQKKLIKQAAANPTSNRLTPLVSSKGRQERMAIELTPSRYGGDLDAAAKTYERISLTAGVGGSRRVDQFEASTILAMIDSRKYANQVIRRWKELFH